jgi:hypothetical protein
VPTPQRSAKALRIAESARLRAEAHIKDVARMFEEAYEPMAAVAIEELKVKAVALNEAQKQIDVLRGEAQPKIDPAFAAREQVKASQAACVFTLHSKAAPISVFINRKTQRLYSRFRRRKRFPHLPIGAPPAKPLGTAAGFSKQLLRQ